jgi:site-specific recombinase XerD
MAPSPQSRQEELLDRYRRYLADERGITEHAADLYTRTARQFVAEHCSRGEPTLEHLTVGDVTSFVTRHCRSRSVGSAKLLATGLRSFLGFSHVAGLISLPLAAAVPSAAGWSGAGLPRGLAPGEVARLLASCDRSSSTGRRDYAILVVLIRLGLRATEAASLSIDDLDWRAGELVVRGKGRCEERLPLPVDVGEAIASYLQQGRPRRPERELFLRVHAPLRRLSPESVAEVVRAAGERAGLGSFGAHRLRHTAATEMLRAGATLSEVAQVLRHRSTASTVLYAKVDHLALVTLAMPWPDAGR